MPPVPLPSPLQEHLARAVISSSQTVLIGNGTGDVMTTEQRKAQMLGILIPMGWIILGVVGVPVCFFSFLRLIRNWGWWRLQTARRPEQAGLRRPKKQFIRTWRGWQEQDTNRLPPPVQETKGTVRRSGLLDKIRLLWAWIPASPTRKEFGAIWFDPPADDPDLEAQTDGSTGTIVRRERPAGGDALRIHQWMSGGADTNRALSTVFLDPRAAPPAGPSRDRRGPRGTAAEPETPEQGSKGSEGTAAPHGNSVPQFDGASHVPESVLTTAKVGSGSGSGSGSGGGGRRTAALRPRRVKRRASGSASTRPRPSTKREQAGALTMFALHMAVGVLRRSRRQISEQQQQEAAGQFKRPMSLGTALDHYHDFFTPSGRLRDPDNIHLPHNPFPPPPNTPGDADEDKKPKLLDQYPVWSRAGGGTAPPNHTPLEGWIPLGRRPESSKRSIGPARGSDPAEPSESSESTRRRVNHQTRLPRPVQVVAEPSESSESARLQISRRVHYGPKLPEVHRPSPPPTATSNQHLPLPLVVCGLCDAHKQWSKPWDQPPADYPHKFRNLHQDRNIHPQPTRTDGYGIVSMYPRNRLDRLLAERLTVPEKRFLIALDKKLTWLQHELSGGFRGADSNPSPLMRYKYMAGVRVQGQSSNSKDYLTYQKYGNCRGAYISNPKLDSWRRAMNSFRRKRRVDPSLQEVFLPFDHKYGWEMDTSAYILPRPPDGNPPQPAFELWPSIDTPTSESSPRQRRASGSGSGSAINDTAFYTPPEQPQTPSTTSPRTTSPTPPTIPTQPNHPPPPPPTEAIVLSRLQHAFSKSNLRKARKDLKKAFGRGKEAGRVGVEV